MQNIRCCPETPMRSESTPPRVSRRHWTGLVRLLGAVILVVALAAAIVGMLAMRFGQLPIGGADGNAGPAGSRTSGWSRRPSRCVTLRPA